VSSIVPDPKTRCLGKPLIFHVTQAMMSHGLLTTTMTASGLYLTSSGMRFLKMSTFLCTRSRRDSPSFWRTPAVMIITREFCSHNHIPKPINMTEEQIKASLSSFIRPSSSFWVSCKSDEKCERERQWGVLLVGWEEGEGSHSQCKLILP